MQPICDGDHTRFQPERLLVLPWTKADSGGENEPAGLRCGGGGVYPGEGNNSLPDRLHLADPGLDCRSRPRGTAAARSGSRREAHGEKAAQDRCLPLWQSGLIFRNGEELSLPPAGHRLPSSIPTRAHRAAAKPCGAAARSAAAYAAPGTRSCFSVTGAPAAAVERMAWASSWTGACAHSRRGSSTRARIAGKSSAARVTAASAGSSWGIFCRSEIGELWLTRQAAVYPVHKEIAKWMASYRPKLAWSGSPCCR